MARTQLSCHSKDHHAKLPNLSCAMDARLAAAVAAAPAAAAVAAALRS